MHLHPFLEELVRDVDDYAHQKSIQMIEEHVLSQPFQAVTLLAVVVLKRHLLPYLQTIL